MSIEIAGLVITAILSAYVGATAWRKGYSGTIAFGVALLSPILVAPVVFALRSREYKDGAWFGTLYFGLDRPNGIYRIIAACILGVVYALGVSVLLAMSFESLGWIANTPWYKFW